MKKYLLLFTLCPLLSSGQEREYTGTNIKLCPTAASIFPFPAIQLSVEQQLDDHFSLQLEAGYGFYLNYDEEFTHIKDTAFIKPVGLKLNGELRHYFGRQTREFYLGLNAFYRYHLTNGTLEYHTPSDSFTILRDGVVAKNNTFGAALVMGIQKKWGWFVFNPFVGAGMLSRNISTTHREYNPDNGDYLARDIEWHLSDEFEYSNLSENSGQLFYFTLGVRIGYAFRKLKY